MERDNESKRERDEGEEWWGGGVTERVVYWPRKCSQAAGQSAWFLPLVSLTAHWPMKASLYSLFQSAAHTIKRRAVYLSLPSPTQFALFLSCDPSLLCPSPLTTFTLCLSSPKILSHNKRGQMRLPCSADVGTNTQIPFVFSLPSHRTASSSLNKTQFYFTKV